MSSAANTHEVTAIEIHDSRVTAVRTNHGSVRTDTVICTAGAWSQRIGEMAGVLLPVVPVREADRLDRTGDAADANGAIHPGSGQYCAHTTPEMVCCWESPMP